MTFLLNGKPVDALALIVHRSAQETVGRQWVKKLRKFSHPFAWAMPTSYFRQSYPSTIVRSTDSGSSWEEGYRSRNFEGYASGRYCWALWRSLRAQNETPRKSKGRETKNEENGNGRPSPRGLLRHPQQQKIRPHWIECAGQVTLHAI